MLGAVCNLGVTIFSWACCHLSRNRLEFLQQLFTVWTIVILTLLQVLIYFCLRTTGIILCSSTVKRVYYEVCVCWTFRNYEVKSCFLPDTYLGILFCFYWISYLSVFSRLILLNQSIAWLSVLYILFRTARHSKSFICALLGENLVLRLLFISNFTTITEFICSNSRLEKCLNLSSITRYCSWTHNLVELAS